MDSVIKWLLTTRLQVQVLLEKLVLTTGLQTSTCKPSFITHVNLSIDHKFICR